MAQETQGVQSLESLFSQWMASATAFWSTMTDPAAAPWLTAKEAPRPAAKEKTEPERGLAMLAAMKNWQVFARMMLDPSGIQSVVKGLGTFPDLITTMAQNSMEGLLELQENWRRFAAKYQETGKPYSYEDLDREFLNRWSSVYEKEFSRFFKIPQLGLARFYLEDASDTFDKYNRCQAAITEFLHLIYLPMERAWGVLQEKVAEMAEAGTLPEDPKAIYQMWVKILEGHYMTLFKSPEYTESMAKTMSALNSFLSSRNKVIESLLQGLPIATHKELDTLYEEIYELKKRLRHLEKAAKA